MEIVNKLAEVTGKYQQTNALLETRRHLVIKMIDSEESRIGMFKKKLATALYYQKSCWKKGIDYWLRCWGEYWVILYCCPSQWHKHTQTHCLSIPPPLSPYVSSCPPPPLFLSLSLSLFLSIYLCIYLCISLSLSLSLFQRLPSTLILLPFIIHYLYTLVWYDFGNRRWLVDDLSITSWRIVNHNSCQTIISHYVALHKTLMFTGQNRLSMQLLWWTPHTTARNFQPSSDH